MKDEIVLSDNFNHVYDDINDLIKRKSVMLKMLLMMQ